MSKWVFIHVPKTAGTSFVEGLKRAVGHQNISPLFVASFLSPEDAVRLDKYDVIAGHISIDDVRKYFPDRRILTVLRDPIDRCISWYYFAKAIKIHSDQLDVTAAQQLDIEDFFNSDINVLHKNICNRTVRQLGSHVLELNPDYDITLRNASETIRSAAWVGHVSSIEADVERLKNTFPEFGAFHMSRDNVTANRRSTGELDAPLIEAIRRLNAFDLELLREWGANRPG